MLGVDFLKMVHLFFLWMKKMIYQKHFCNMFSDLENSSWYIKWKSKLQHSKHSIISYLQNNYIYIYIYTQKIGIMLPEHTEILSFALNGDLKAYLFLCAFL